MRCWREMVQCWRGSDLEFGSQHLPNKPGFLCRPVISALREAEKRKKKSREFDGF